MVEIPIVIHCKKSGLPIARYFHQICLKSFQLFQTGSVVGGKCCRQIIVLKDLRRNEITNIFAYYIPPITFQNCHRNMNSSCLVFFFSPHQSMAWEVPFPIWGTMRRLGGISSPSCQIFYFCHTVWFEKFHSQFGGECGDWGEFQPLAV